MANFSFADNGAMVYVSSEGAEQRYPIVRVDRDGNVFPLWDQPGRYTTPRFSPDGTRVAISAMGEANTAQADTLKEVNTKTSEQHERLIKLMAEQGKRFMMLFVVTVALAVAAVMTAIVGIVMQA